MKVIAVTSERTVLVEVSISDLKRITEYKWEPGYSTGYNSDLSLRSFKPGDEIDLPKIFDEAKDLLKTFRGIAPGLRQSAKGLEKLASQVELHEPDVSLLPKKES